MALAQVKNIDEALELIDRLNRDIQNVKDENLKNQILLGQRETNLIKINQKIQEQFSNIARKNQEVDFLLKITNFEVVENDLRGLFANFLELSAMFVWCDVCFAVKIDEENKNVIPITNFILNSDSNLQKANEEKFLKINFDYFLSYCEIVEHVALSDLNKFSSTLTREYKNLNYCYIFPIEIDKHDKVLVAFAFNFETILNERTIELLLRGLNQLKITLQKYKSKRQLLENYKKLKDMKSQLIQSEKMASIGTISAGIAHEINNPLSFLLTNTEVLKDYIVKIFKYLESIKKDSQFLRDEKIENEINYILEDTPALLSESLEGIQRIREIVNGLRTFSRADEGELKNFEINECVESSLKLVSNELKHKCKVVKCLQANSRVKGAPGQIIQVLTNLLVNSAQAIDNFGEIVLETYSDGVKVYISIEDNGCGISQDNLKNLFTPFFTTKPTGKGTGLGLSISYGIIKKHQGKIFVESKENIGTKFIIELPVVKDTTSESL